MEAASLATSQIVTSSSLPLCRRVNLGEILTNDYKSWKSGDFVEVKVLHSFYNENSLPRNYLEYHFILADQESCITAVLYGNYEDGFKVCELYQKLKEGSILRIMKFEVMTAIRRSQSKDANESNFLLRNQTKRLKLINSVNYFQEIYANVQMSFFDRIPFAITRLDQLDGSRGKCADLLALVKRVGDRMYSANATPYRIVTLCMSMSTSQSLPDFKNTEKRIAFFGKRLIEMSLRVGGLYVFSNISIKDDPMYGLSPFTTWRTAIIEVTEQNIGMILPADQQNHKSFVDYKDVNDPSLEHDFTCSDANEVDKWLVEIFSQLTVLGTESVPERTTETSQSHQQSTVMISKNTENLCYVASPYSSPCKRSLLSCELTSSPPKKLRISSSGEENVNEGTGACKCVPFQAYSQCTPQRFTNDFKNQKFPYKVVVEPATTFKDIGPNAYPMRSKIRGLALIINNFFPESSHLERSGSYFDVVYLYEFLKYCKFQITTYRDLASYELKSAIQKFKHEIQNIGAKNFDALFIAVLSHGTLGAIAMNDQVTVPLYDDIIHPFDEINFPILEGKPKIFVVQACQNLPSIQDVQLRRNVLTPPVKRELKNMIVCYGTSPGHLSYRDIFLGSHFIYVLVDILMRHSRNCHFVEMLEKVQESLSHVSLSQNASLTCTWNPYRFHKLYFNPGL